MAGQSSQSDQPNVTTVPLAGQTDVMMNYAMFQASMRRRLPALVREYRPDILITNHAQMPDLLVGRRKGDPPVLVATHTTIRGQSMAVWRALRNGSPLDTSEKMTLLGLFGLLPAEMYYWKRVRNAIFVSDFVRKEVEGAYGPRLRVSSTVFNGLDIEGIRSMADKAGRPDLPTERSVLFASRMLAWKGLADLFRAMRHLGPKAPTLYLTGSGNVDMWENYIESLGISGGRVRFLGSIPREDLVGLMKNVSCFVLPSYSESCPFSLMEAMALGTPIVATKVEGSMRMVDDGVSALLVPPGDHVALGNAILRLVDDPELGRNLARTALARAREDYTAERMCRETLAVYERVVAG